MNTRILTTFFCLLTLFTLQSCEKVYKDYSNMEVVEDTFGGELSASELNGDVDVEFFSDGTSGTYCFIWENTSREAVFNVRMAGTGRLRVEVDEARGKVVENRVVETSEPDAFTTDKGAKGKWFVKLFFDNFSGEGTLDLSPE